MGVVGLNKKKLGRPTNNPKDTTMKFRFDKETLRKMEACSKALHISKSEVVRGGVHLMYQEVFHED